MANKGKEVNTKGLGYRQREILAFTHHGGNRCSISPSDRKSVEGLERRGILIVDRSWTNWIVRLAYGVEIPGVTFDGHVDRLKSDELLVTD